MYYRRGEPNPFAYETNANNQRRTNLGAKTRTAHMTAGRCKTQRASPANQHSKSTFPPSIIIKTTLRTVTVLQTNRHAQGRGGVPYSFLTIPDTPPLRASVNHPCSFFLLSRAVPYRPNSSNQPSLLRPCSPSSGDSVSTQVTCACTPRYSSQ